MVKKMKIREINSSELNNYLKAIPHSLYQTEEYAKTMEKQGFNIKILGLEENGNIIGSTILLLGKKVGFNYAFAPRGFVIDYSKKELLKNFTIEIKKYCKKNNIVAIKLNPLIVKEINEQKNNKYDEIYKTLHELKYSHLGYNDFFESFKPRFEAKIEIKDNVTMFNNIKKEYRTKIRSAIDNGVEIHKGTYEDLKYLYLQTEKKYPRDLLYFQYLYYFFNQNKKIDFFYAKLDCQKLLNKYKNLYIKQEEICNKIDEIIENEQSNKITALKVEADNLLGKYHNQLKNANKMIQNNPNGIVIASALFIKENDEVYMIMDGFDKRYKSYNAKHLLIWEIMNYYKDYKYINLGGMTSLKENKYKGLNNFKMNFGSNCYEYIGDLELVCIPSKYFLLKNALPYENIIKK